MPHHLFDGIDGAVNGMDSTCLPCDGKRFDNARVALGPCLVLKRGVLVDDQPRCIVGHRRLEGVLPSELSVCVWAQQKRISHTSSERIANWRPCHLV